MSYLSYTIVQTVHRHKVNNSFYVKGLNTIKNSYNRIITYYTSIKPRLRK
jgi:hypothetical protein